MFHRPCSTWSQLLRLHATDSFDPVTALRFRDRSKRRKRHHVLIRADHLVAFTLAGWDPARQVDLSLMSPPFKKWFRCFSGKVMK